MAKNTVKCRYCKKELDKALAYHPLERMYYCSEEHYILQHGYDLIIADAESLVGDKMKYYVRDNLMAVMQERGYEISKSYWDNDKEYLLNLMNRKRNEIRAGAGNYLGQTMKNRLLEYEMPEPKKEEVPVDVEYDDFSKYKRIKKRRALIDIEMECDGL